MQYTVECDCGWSCRGAEEEIVASCIEHGREAHGLDLSRDQVLAVAQPLESGDPARLPEPRRKMGSSADAATGAAS